MKVGLNATCFNERPSGANQRFLGIYTELVKQLPNTEFIIYEPSDCRVGEWFSQAPNVRSLSTPIPSTRRLGKIIGPAYWKSVLSRENFDIFEGFNLPFSAVPQAHSLLTIHDIRRLSPHISSFKRNFYYQVLSRAINKVDRVITVSKTMREEILEHYPELPVSVIYNGISSIAARPVDMQKATAVSNRLGFPGNFILTVGHLEERKNLHRLIQSVARLREQGEVVNLLIIGNDNGDGKAINETISRLRLNDMVKVYSGLSDLQVRCAYALADLFVFPSRYEGFGIPILEAMAAGTPVVLSDIPVFREITEDSAVYFPTDNVEIMAETIGNLLHDKKECERLIDYGYSRIPDFSYPVLAAQTAQLYALLD